MELVTNGQRLLMIARRLPQPIGSLGPRQIEWCERHLNGFSWPRVQRLSQHAAVAYERAQGTEARNSVRETV